MAWILTTVLLAIGCVLLELAWRKRWEKSQARLLGTEQLLAGAIEEKKRLLEEEFAKRQAWLDAMFEGVLQLDREQRVVFANLALQRMLGLHGDIKGRLLGELLPRPEVLETVEKARRDGQVIGAPLLIEDLSPRHLQINASSLPGSPGNPGGTLLIFHDLTRLRQMEQTRRDFVANVSHELRTPLSLIKGWTETLLHAESISPADSRRFLQSIDKHASRLMFLIEDLLVLSRLESGSTILNIDAWEASELVSQVFDSLESVASARGVKLQSRVPQPFEIKADRDRLHQVFFNLVENAIKYGRESGTVTVSARILADGRVEMCVQDDGAGIPTEAREQIFERFYRVDRARSRETGGTGLGLSIVKHIVQLHGGEVWVQSRPGSGAAFYFTIPQ